MNSKIAHGLVFGILAITAASAFASPSKELSCRSLKGQKPEISYHSVEDDAQAWTVTAVMKIDGLRGEMSDQVESNDAGGEIMISVGENSISAYANLTSDDSQNMSANLDSIFNTVKMTKGTSEQNGSAKFQARISGSVSKGRKIRSSKNDLVDCVVKWNSSKP